MSSWIVLVCEVKWMSWRMKRWFIETSFGIYSGRIEGMRPHLKKGLIGWSRLRRGPEGEVGWAFLCWQTHVNRIFSVTFPQCKRPFTCFHPLPSHSLKHFADLFWLARTYLHQQSFLYDFDFLHIFRLIITLVPRAFQTPFIQDPQLSPSFDKENFVQNGIEPWEVACLASYDADEGWYTPNSSSSSVLHPQLLQPAS